MIIHEKMVDVIRNALVDYESATGLECQIRYADRLSAVVEVVLELAEEMPEISVGSPIAMRLPETTNLHKSIIKMRTDGKSVAEIAEALGISKPTIYEHLDFQRKQEAK